MYYYHYSELMNFIHYNVNIYLNLFNLKSNMNVLKAIKTTNNLPTIQISLDLLIPTVKYDEGIVKLLLKDIPISGLQHPLLIVKPSFYELYTFNKKWSLSVPYMFEKFYVNGGSCRLEAIKRLGYECVDCIIMDTFDDCTDLQYMQRRDFLKWY